MFELLLSNQAKKDAKKLAGSNLKSSVNEIFKIISENPYATYPAYEKLINKGMPRYSRRINKQHRVVYEVYEKEKIVYILRMWTHYE